MLDEKAARTVKAGERRGRTRRRGGAGDVLLREFFAGCALIGLLRIDAVANREDYAVQSYKLADAMLERRAGRRMIT